MKNKQNSNQKLSEVGMGELPTGWWQETPPGEIDSNF